MWDKRHHAAHIVGILTFSSTAINTWVDLLRARSFSGERFLWGCAQRIRQVDTGLEGLRGYTFNRLAESEPWRIDVLGRLQARPGMNAWGRSLDQAVQFVTPVTSFPRWRFSARS